MCILDVVQFLDGGELSCLEPQHVINKNLVIQKLFPVCFNNVHPTDHSSATGYLEKLNGHPKCFLLKKYKPRNYTKINQKI